MHITSVPPSELSTKRLDSDFYHPDYMELTSRLSKHPLRELRGCGKFFAGPFGSKLPSNLYLSAGIPLFRVGNVGQFEVEEEGFAYLAPSVHQELISSEVTSGDLLIVKASVGEKICRVPENIKKANITQHIIAIHPNGKVDMDYISSFLFSSYGRKQLERYSLGSIIQYLGINDARSVLYFDLDPLAQKYIGDKVRQAVRLKGRARFLGDIARDIFNNDIHWNEAVLEVQKYGKVGVSELKDRLDLKFNSLERISVNRLFSSKKIEVTPLSILVDISAMIGWKGLTTEYYRDHGPWLLRGVEFADGVINTDELVCVDEFKYSEQPQIHLQKNDIAFSKDGTIGKAVVVPKLPNRLAAGSTIARLRIKEDVNIDSYYLEFALGHPCVQVQIESFATGIAQPHITQEWIAQLQIPRVKNEKTIASKWHQHHEGLNSAKLLTKAAKYLVEALIEGHVPEQQLIDAQKALDADDNGLDRDILSRLTTSGLDGDGELLFTDLDQLYDLLVQSQEIGQ